MLQAKPIGRGLTGSILSLSLLTVMAGAAVAPALNVIQAHFAQSSQTFVQMIISIPALFIVITNFFFPKLCRRLNPRTLVLLGLSLYTVGGCAAGLFDQIGLVLVMRALVGVGVGILMPLSTGLLTDYFPPEKQASLLGISSAMNQLGGVIATLLAGLLAGISWRASFLVYLYHSLVITWFNDLAWRLGIGRVSVQFLLRVVTVYSLTFLGAMSWQWVLSQVRRPLTLKL